MDRLWFLEVDRGVGLATSADGESRELNKLQTNWDVF